MEIKLVKAYRHNYFAEFGSDDKSWFLDAFHAEIKVKKENPEFYPWEGFLCCTLRIHYDGHAFANGNHWSLSSFSDRTDEVMKKVFGETFLTFGKKKEVIAAIEKIVPFFPLVYYRNGKEFKYELA